MNSLLLCLQDLHLEGLMVPKCAPQAHLFRVRQLVGERISPLAPSKTVRALFYAYGFLTLMAAS